MERLTFKKRIFLYVIVLFLVFTVSVIWVQYNREQAAKEDSLLSSLDDYAELVERVLVNEDIFTGDYKLLSQIVPANLRLTIIEESGKVLYDNNKNIIEDHSHRPEIEEARIDGKGWKVRYSTTLNREYLYYAKRYGNLYVRVALPYDVEVKKMLSSDKYFVIFVLFLFGISVLVVNRLASSIGGAISGLKHFLDSADKGDVDLLTINFSNTELGDISSKVIANYKLLDRNRQKLKEQQEKLESHFNNSNEGIAIFSAKDVVVYSNSHFVNSINLFLDNASDGIEELFQQEELLWIGEALDSWSGDSGEGVTCRKVLNNAQYFEITLIIFNSKGFEIIINDVTATEKTKLLKQQMTGNIAHELKTPVSSIRGYLETLLEHDNITQDKQRFFLERSYAQTLRLSDLVSDITLITKMEEASDLFRKSEVNIVDTVKEVLDDLAPQIERVNDTVINNLIGCITVNGDRSLIYAIFRNLVENALRYAGGDIEIVIECLKSDDKYYYFSVRDGGIGIDNEHINRIFERFYRVNSGRTRQSGGSGLGLSIVKNAISLHGGDISARNRKEGGLEFVFSLPISVS